MTPNSLAISELLVSAFATVLQDHQAIYCSGAITSGERALEWLRARKLSSKSLDELPSELKAQFEREVISVNLADLANFAQAVRKNSGSPCINPGVLQNVEMWKQPDWHHFWCNIIERFATAVALGPGWPYSTGACIEVRFAVLQGIQLLNEFAEPVQVSEAISQMQVAAATKRRYGMSTDRLEGVIADLCQHNAKR